MDEKLTPDEIAELTDHDKVLMRMKPVLYWPGGDVVYCRRLSWEEPDDLPLYRREGVFTGEGVIGG